MLDAQAARREAVLFEHLAAADDLCERRPLPVADTDDGDVAVVRGVHVVRGLAVASVAISGSCGRLVGGAERDGQARKQRRQRGVEHRDLDG